MEEGMEGEAEEGRHLMWWERRRKRRGCEWRNMTREEKKGTKERQTLRGREDESTALTKRTEIGFNV